MHNHSSPVILLVRPQMGENIGAAARAMMNFGLHNLRIVAPRDGWPNAKAYEMAAHAKPIIERAEIYETIPEALHDCHLAVAATARKRDSAFDYYTPKTLASFVFSGNVGQTAFMFGPENNGLSNEDTSYCQGIVTIPTHPDCASLNIAQSVVILAYEWFQTFQGEKESSLPDNLLTATIKEIDHLYQRLILLLQSAGHFPVDQPQESLKLQLRQMFGRSQFTSSDVQAFHGILKSLSKEISGNRH